MDAIPELERVLFFQGELLTADDLTTVDDNNRQLRWLHNRSLHNWGIGFGLDVLGARGDTSVTVAPGYAIDSNGREIILSSSMKQPTPAVPSGTYYLVADYVDDSGQTAEGQRGATACNASGAVRLSNVPLIAWKTVSQLNVGIDIVLAQVVIQNCVLKQNPSSSPRRYSTPGFLPYLKAGQVSANDLTWGSWTDGTTSGFSAAIDTTAAGFQSTPLYISQIIGERALPSFVVVDYVSIRDSSPIGFALQVALPALGGNVNPPGKVDANTFNQLHWQVVWMGIEQ